MGNALAVLRETAGNWWNSMVGLALINSIWLAASLTVILMPPATAGVYYVARSVSMGEGHQSDLFLEGARRYFWISLRWGLLNLVVGGLIYMDLLFYGQAEGPMPSLLSLLLMVAILLWSASQFYVWPFLMLQEDKRLRLALKNSLFLTLAAPLYTLTLLLVSGFILMLGLLTVLPLAFFCITFIALLGNMAVIERMRTYGKIPAS